MHKPRKRFGQNFLKDTFVIERIVNAIHPKSNEILVEIGPGHGVLTQYLLHKVLHLHIIEIDRDLIPQLKILALDKPITIHEADALHFDFAKLIYKTPDKKLRIVGNLPYNISTPLIFHLLKFRNLIADMHFMLQKEVVERMTATPNHKTYGRLSIMVQYYCQATQLFNVPPTAFYPAPKVDSAIVRLKPYEQLPYPVTDEAVFATIVREAFNHRRKTLANALKELMTKDQIIKAHIDPKMRPEQLSILDYTKLAEK